MAASGIKASDDVLRAADELYAQHKSHFLIMVVENQQVNVEHTKPASEAFDYDRDFFPLLTSKKEPRFALVNIKWTDKEGRFIDRVYFIHWNPDNSPVRQKMLYASTAETFKGAVKSHKKVQGADAGEVTLEALKSVA